MAACLETLEARQMLAVDTKPPVTSHSLDGTAGNAGWWRGDVTVVLDSFDRAGVKAAGVQNITYSIDGGASVSVDGNIANFMISKEGTTTIVYYATDDLGNVESPKTVSFKIDKTGPDIMASRITAANASGWNNTDVEISYSASDGVSGLVSAGTGNYIFTAEGASQSHTFTVTDQAGNSASATVSGVNIDRTAPTLSASLDKIPDANGWYNIATGAPTVSFVLSDALSGGANPASHTFADGIDQSWFITATDLAGNVSNSAGVSGIYVDTTAPTVSYTRTPANANGWNNGDVSVWFSGTDATSGVASEAGDATLSIEGADQSVTGIVTDDAGNVASFTVRGISIDKTAPQLVWGSTGANADGWNNADFSLSFGVSDNLSGVESSSPQSPVSFTEDGVDQTRTVRVTDRAGNWSDFVSPNVNFDETAPSSGGAVVDGSAGNNGWWRSDVMVSLWASDNLSGASGTLYQIDGGAWQTFSGDFAVSGDGIHTINYYSTDVAGNAEATQSFQVKIDTAAPTIDAWRDGVDWAAAHGGWNNSDVTAAYSAYDNGSGLADAATGSHVFTGDGFGQSHTFVVWDLAGNSASATVADVNIDKTGPVAIISPDPGSQTPGTVTEWNVSDPLSGVDPASVTVMLDGVLISTDLAGGVTLGTGVHKLVVQGTDMVSNPIYSNHDYFVAGASIVGVDLVIVGTDEADTITVDASDPNNVLVSGVPVGGSLQLGLGGKIIVQALGGDDTVTVVGFVQSEIYGGWGNDAIRGGWANDLIHGEDGNDWLNGRAGNDSILGGLGADKLIGGGGNDVLVGGYGADKLYGNSGNDVVIGGELGSSKLLGIISGKVIAWSSTRIREVAEWCDDGEADLLCGGGGENWLFNWTGDVIKWTKGIQHLALT